MPSCQKGLTTRPFLSHPTEKAPEPTIFSVGWHLPVRWIFVNFADEGNKPKWLEDGGRDSLGQQKNASRAKSATYQKST